MRLRRLDLTRYGLFTDHKIDFGPRDPKNSDFHIIFGLNETGKSTALAAFLDLVFGIEPRSRYNFLHPYNTMEIGARLEIAGRCHELKRRKGKGVRGDLVTAGGQPLDKGILTAALSGIDREAYQTRFSLDDETLEEGGESILASKGDLGELLFAASAGLADFSRTLSALRDEADEFHKPGAHKTTLVVLKTKLDDLQRQKKQLEVTASDYAKLIKVRNKAEAAYDEASQTRSRLNQRLEDVRRLLDGLPLLGKLREVEKHLSQLGELPEPPVRWADDIAAVMDDETRLATRLGGIDDEIHRLNKSLAAIACDDKAFVLADRLDDIKDAEARYLTAVKDIPARQEENWATDARIQTILLKLGEERDNEPDWFVLPRSVRDGFQELITSWSGIEQILKATRAERDAAQQERDKACAALAKESGAGVSTDFDFEQLANTLESVRGEVSDARALRKQAQTARDEHRGKLDRHMIRLLPWRGNAAILEQLSVPAPEEIDNWKQLIAAHQKQRDHHEREVERLTTEIRTEDAESREIKKSAQILDDDETDSLRTERDEAWLAHRKALDARTADAFEQALGKDDMARQARFDNATDVAGLRTAGKALTKKRAQRERSIELRTKTDAALCKINGQIARAIGKMDCAEAESLPLDIPLERFEGWIKQRDEAIEILADISSSDRDIARAGCQLAAARDRLGAALSAVGLDVDRNMDLEVMLTKAGRVVKRAGRLRSLQDDVKRQEDHLARRQREFKAASDKNDDWQREWAEAIARCWLGAVGRKPTVAEMGSILKAADQLQTEVESQSVLADRIGKMERDEREFVDSVGRLAKEADETFDAKDPLSTLKNLQKRVEKARRDKKTKAERARELEDAEKRRGEVMEDLAVHGRRKDEMVGFFGVEDLTAVNRKLDEVNKRSDLLERQGDLEAQIIDRLKQPFLEQALSVLRDADRDDLEQEAEALKNQLGELEKQTEALFAQLSKAQEAVDAVDDGDETARIAEKRQTVLLEIKDQALRYLRLKLGITMAEQALRMYREKHRSAMMDEASRAFKLISRGHYAKLASQADKDSEVLIAVAASGHSNRPGQLSKGARFQLYLALRVAGYHEFANTRPPPPFIADDILETFDDPRAEETLRLFSNMADKGQVIYLTHHRHLLDIARQVCPAVKVHELPKPQMAR